MWNVISWILRQTLRLILAVVVLVVITGGALYVTTRGDYPVPATVMDDATLRRIEIDGITLHAKRFGLTKGRTVIVLHGGPGGDYRSQLALRALSNQYQVVFYDQRGAGLSERVPEDRLSLRGHLNELSGVIDLVSPDAPVILIGHSWGAVLAAAYLGHDPTRVAGAVLIEPGFLDWTGFQAWMAAASTTIRSWHMIRTAARAWGQSLHVSGDADAASDHMMGEIVAAFADRPEMGYRCPQTRFDAASWRFGARANSTVSAKASPDDIDAIAAGARVFPRPVLILTGACSTVIGAELQTRHADLFPKGSLMVIDGAAHDVVWDAPDAALPAIRAYLNRLP